jgi:signal transduction histidine kinase
MARSDRLQLCLVRASEMNVHLREMNIAAAGLAHETRNPLNIVRGLAHMIGKTANVSKEITKQSSEITEEVDRVTGRLNEFIDYSKPHEAKFATTNLNAIIQDVERTLESDQQEKGIQFELHGPELTVEADQALLRQVLFNLLLNSIQAVERDGRIEVHVQKDGASEAALEIRDNGPGVPAEARENIFRPYFTTTKGGTGLGLAVVRQIVLAHRWEINYLPGNNGGSRFRISGLKLA